MIVNNAQQDLCSNQVFPVVVCQGQQPTVAFTTSSVLTLFGIKSV